MGYYADIATKPEPGNQVSLVVTLEPITIVRFVKVDIDKSSFSRICEPVFADDLKRRMTLRPGSQLVRAKTAQATQLRRDAERLANHLRSLGYFDAEVTISSRPKGVYAAELLVSIKPGRGYRMGKVAVFGNTTLSSEEIADVFRHRRNLFARAICPDERVFSREQLAVDRAEVEAMYHRRGYPGAKVSIDFDMRSSYKRDTKTVELNVTIRERRRIDVQFVGNSEGRNFSESQLSKSLTFSEEGAYDDVEVQASADAIARYYQSKGRFQASVTWARFPLSAAVGEGARSDVFERIYFYINEGPKLPVRQIEFVGNKAIKTAKLKGTIKTQVFRRVIIGSLGGYATTVQLAQDVRRLRNLYRVAGYRAAGVRVRAAPRRDVLESAPALAAAIASGAEATGLHLRFLIDEGERETVSRVDFLSTDINPIPIERLRAEVSHRAGEPFLEDDAISDGQKLEDLYFSRGYPRAKVTPLFERPEELEGQVVLVYQITSNSQARIGKVALRGNFKTKPWVILDELRLREGDLLTLRVAERAQGNLRASGLFSTVNLDYIGFEDLRENTVNVLVNVEERYDYRGSIELSGGISTDRGPFAGARYEHRNLFGVGVRTDGSVVLGTQEQRAEAKVVVPRWITRRAVGTALLWETSAHYINEDVERFGDLQTIGVGTAATKEGTKRFFRGWLLSMRYNFRRRNRDRELVRPAGSSDDVQTDKITTRASTLGPVLVVDRRTDRDGNTNPLSPAKGFMVELRSLYAENFALGTDTFIKLGGSGQLYIPLGDRAQLSNGLRYDHGIPLGGAALLPDVERYFAGGDTTVRGFEEDRLAAEIIADELSPFGGLTQFRVLPAGGNIRFIHNLELSLDLWEIAEGLHWSSAIFVDTGLVTNSLTDVGITDLRHSLGTTIARFATPAGSLSFEWAIPLDPELGDNPLGRFHFNVGFLF